MTELTYKTIHHSARAQIPLVTFPETRQVGGEPVVGNLCELDFPPPPLDGQCQRLKKDFFLLFSSQKCDTHPTYTRVLPRPDRGINKTDRVDPLRHSPLATLTLKLTFRVSPNLLNHRSLEEDSQPLVLSTLSRFALCVGGSTLLSTVC